MEFHKKLQEMRKQKGLTQDELAKALYNAGAFKKENAKETMMMLDLMDFDGIGKLRSTIRAEYLSDSGESAI